MSFTYDPSTDRGRVRLLATDTDSDNPIFQDIEIDTFLDIEEDSVKLAAAMALETIASQEALIQKKIKLGDLQTDGPAVAKELRDRAARLRESVDSEVLFDFAQMADSPNAAAEIIYKSALRNL